MNSNEFSQWLAFYAIENAPQAHEKEPLNQTVNDEIASMKGVLK